MRAFISEVANTTPPSFVVLEVIACTGFPCSDAIEDLMLRATVTVAQADRAVPELRLKFSIEVYLGHNKAQGHTTGGLSRRSVSFNNVAAKEAKAVVEKQRERRRATAHDDHYNQISPQEEKVR